MAQMTRRACYLSPCAMIAWMLGASSSVGAVRVCKDYVSSGIVTAQSEKAAKAMAMARWRAQARLLGEGYVRWQIASDRTLVCKAQPGGDFSCMAAAHPCMIEQNPNRRRFGPDGKDQPV